MRLALGVSYAGTAYQGWQSQSSGLTIQDKLEKALSQFCDLPRVSTLCAGRTDAGVHGLMQVVHFDTDIERDPYSWVRGTNRYLPDDISVQWAQEVPAEFHARGSALSRRYAYIVLESPVRPSLEFGRVGWVYRPLDLQNMQEAAQHLNDKIKAVRQRGRNLSNEQAAVLAALHAQDMAFVQAYRS